nr:hypothetical protein [Methylobacterium sp. L1A1]
MDEEWGEIEGLVILDRDLELQGIVTSRLTVKSGVVLILREIVTGDLIVEAGARADVHGVVNGTVFNEGGEVTIWENVDRLGGPYSCSVEPGAIVG